MLPANVAVPGPPGLAASSSAEFAAQALLEFVISGDLTAVGAKSGARRLVARALCRLALTGAEVVAALQAILLEDAMQQVRGSSTPNLSI